MFFCKNLGIRHLQVLLMFLGIALTWAGRLSISVAVVAMTDANSTHANFPTYDWNSEDKAFVLSSFFWVNFLMEIPSGIIADLYSSHKLICCAVFISSLVNALTPLSVYYFGWTGIIVCRVIMGITQSGMVPSCHVFISKWIPYEERSRLGAIILISPNAGTIISMIASAWLSTSPLGWPSIFYVFGVISMLWAILFYFVSAESPSKYKSISSEERDYIVNSLSKSKAPRNESQKLPWKSILTSLPLWALAVISTGHAWGLMLFLYKLPAFIKYGLDYDIEQSGIISALPYAATLSMSFFFIWMCDFALKKGISLHIVRKISSTIGMWGPSVALLALCLIPSNSNVVSLTMLILIFGLDAANVCGFFMNNIDIAPNFAGALIAMCTTIAMAFSQTAPIVCGYIVTDETNIDQWHIIFYIVAGLLFVSNSVFLTLGQTKIQSWN